MSDLNFKNKSYKISAAIFISFFYMQRFEFSGKPSEIELFSLSIYFYDGVNCTEDILKPFQLCVINITDYLRNLSTLLPHPDCWKNGAQNIKKLFVYP